ncbi:MAG: pre-peptidase C-terminal domain-containing protein [Coriobacteriia bacterium]
MSRMKSAAISTAALALTLAVTPAAARPARTVGTPATPPTATAASAIVASADDTFPGTAVQWVAPYYSSGAPIPGEVDAAGSPYDFYSVYLEAGEDVLFELFGPESGADLDLYLCDPAGAPAPDDDGNQVGVSYESISRIANVEGVWSVEVRATSGAGSYELYGTFASADDNVPALPITPTPVSAHLDAFSEWDDVYRIRLNAGDVLTLTLTRTGTYTPGFNPAIYLYAPGTTDILNAAALAAAEGNAFPKTLTFTAPPAGSYYVDLCAFTVEPTTHEYGEVQLTWRISSPVYRFFNFTNNTHFFTPTLDERNLVINSWGHIYQYEGVAYTTNPANNTRPLYRFYNVRSRSHFYTADTTERDRVITTLGYIFTYDGPTYSVNPSRVADSAPVYRFYNVRNGSHFYTADTTERDRVIATLGYIYHYEGPAFWIGQ